MTPKSQPAELPRRERNKQRTRARILEAAAKLFAERGISGTSVEDLAKMADVSRATFFNYFSSKSSVVHHLVVRLEEDFRGSAARRSDGRSTTAERLRGLFLDTSRRLKTAPALYKAIIGEAERGYSEAEESQQRFDRMHRALRGLLADGVTHGEVRTDLSVLELAEMVGGVYIAILHNWRVTPRYPLERRLLSAAKFLADSVSPAAARAAAVTVKGARVRPATASKVPA